MRQQVAQQSHGNATEQARWRLSCSCPVIEIGQGLSRTTPVAMDDRSQCVGRLVRRIHSDQPVKQQDGPVIVLSLKRSLCRPDIICSEGSRTEAQQYEGWREEVRENPMHDAMIPL